MFTTVFIVLTILVAQLLILRHYFLTKIEKFKLAHESKVNLDFRRGYDEGWDAALRWRDQQDRYDRIVSRVDKLLK